MPLRIRVALPFACGLLMAVASSSSGDPSIYDANKVTTTVLGCECASECGSSVAFQCAAQPFCMVKNQHCARGDASWSVTHFGYYDYCVFPQYVPYETLSAGQKHELLLSKIHADPTSGTYPGTAGLLGIFAESVGVSFDAQSDIFPLKRSKYIHSVGTVAPFQFVSNGNHPYTGLFKGAPYGLIRFSSATAPSPSGGFTPGAGIKLLRDGEPSFNFVAMPGLDSQKSSDTNFFMNNFSNHLPVPQDADFGKKLLKRKFWQASYCPLMVGLSDMGSTNGTAAPVTPFQLTLVPAVAVEMNTADYAGSLKNFAKLSSNTKLFDVYATDKPRGLQEHIGSFVTTGAFTTSKFGDQELFFKHQYMEDDWQLHPEWLAAIDKEVQCGMSCSGTTPPGVDKGCSSPFNSRARRLGEHDFLDGIETSTHRALV